jgi:hypothetical protein
LVSAGNIWRMAVRRHAPKITPLISAAVLLLTTVFLLHRLHPGGAMAVFRGETPKQAAPVPAPQPEETVAWGEGEGVQIGITLSRAGSGWLRIVMRNTGPHEVILASGMEPERSGKFTLVIQDRETSQSLRANALDPAAAFRVVLPPTETISVVARLPDLKGQPGALRRYAVRVAWSGPVERRVGTDIHGEDATLESGTLYLSKAWPAFVAEPRRVSESGQEISVGIEDTRIRPPDGGR